MTDIIIIVSNGWQVIKSYARINGKLIEIKTYDRNGYQVISIAPK